MLTFFPTPYPDELFYSVLCRWYLLNGIREHKASKRALFLGRENVHMGTLYPNTAVNIVASQLSPDLFPARRLLLEHTTFPYYARMYLREVRMEMLENLIAGRGQAPSHLWDVFQRENYLLRYCPCCMREDAAVYGEAYYHVEHQIPLVQVCRKHKCRLEPIPINAHRTYLDETFLPLETLELDNQADYEISDSEQSISQAVWEYLKLPLPIGPTPGHNNLYQTLLNQGYGIIRPQNGRLINHEKLYSDLCTYHGEELVRKEFGSTQLTTPVMNRIKNWKTLVPDRFILLQTMLGFSTLDVFSTKPMRDPLEERLRNLEKQGGFRTQKQVMAEMGLRAFELNALIREFKMEKFWIGGEAERTMKARTKRVHISLSESEIAELRAAAEQLGYRGLSQFAVDSMRSVIQQNLKATNTRETENVPMTHVAQEG